MQQLILYLLGAMMAWVPVRNLVVGADTEETVRARYESIASDIAAVALDEDEPPVFAGSAGRSKSSLLVAAVASYEGGFQRFVDEGECNKPGFKADRRGSCDGGHAFTLWQIHAKEFGGGFLLGVDGSIAGTRFAPAAALLSGNVVTAEGMLADRKVAARVAQRLLRQSLRTYGSMCAYTGESCAEGAHPKAAARLERAKAYFAAHPFADPAPEKLAAAIP